MGVQFPQQNFAAAMQMQNALAGVGQALARGDIQGAQQALISAMYSNLANDPIASRCCQPGQMGGIQPDFGNFAQPGQFGCYGQPQGLPQWAQGGGMQLPPQLQQMLEGGQQGLQDQMRTDPRSGLGKVDMKELGKAVDDVDINKIVHDIGIPDNLKNEQEVKDTLVNKLFDAQKDGKITDEELTAAIDEAMGKAQGEIDGACGNKQDTGGLSEQESASVKRALTEALDPYTADNIAADQMNGDKPVGPGGTIPTELGVEKNEAGNQEITTPGGYKVELEDQGTYYDVKITDPEGNVSHHWGDPHVDESDNDGGLNKDTDYFWPDKNLSIELPDGSKVSMHATGPQGVIEGVEVHSGDQYVSANAGQDAVDFHESGGKAFDQATADGTVCYPGPAGQGGGIADLFVQETPPTGGYRNLNPNESEHYDNLADFFHATPPEQGQQLPLDPDLQRFVDNGLDPKQAQEAQLGRNLQQLLTFLQNNSGQGYGGQFGQLQNAGNQLANAGVNMQNPAAQNYANQMAYNQFGGQQAQANFPTYAGAAQGFNPAQFGYNPNQVAGGGGGVPAGGNMVPNFGAPQGGSSMDQFWNQFEAGQAQSSAAQNAKYDNLAAQGVDPGQIAMMKMQDEMQRQNQLVSMLTNLSKIKHDTLKAVIQNLRV
ncbi:MAG: hypothetical protein HYV63_13135 [Candidatus Schekmanbacteria bacterium]|nr:hypothetical protein [Candidatus Schekmanbacteria bacterium]